MTSRRVVADSDRQRVQDFFDQHLHESTGWRIPSRTTDHQIGIPSNIRIIEQAGTETIQAAIFSSNSPDDVHGYRERGNHRVADIIAAEMMMIHEVAVSRPARGRGVGRALVRQALDDATASGATIATVSFNTTRRGLVEFYQRAGLTILPRGVPLTIDFAAKRTIGFPQGDSRYAWGYRLLRPHVAVKTTH